jgi:hypothetical protein
MTIRRKVLIVAGVLVLVLSASLVLLLTNINWIVKNAIEHYGSQVTKTHVQVASVNIRLTKGSGSIEGLTVANPKGFSSPHILALGSISVRIEPRTVASSVVVIDDVRIERPQIVYEMDDSRTSNIEVLKKNIGAPATAATKHESEETAAKRLRIRKLVIENSRVDIRVTALGDKPRTITLRKVEMQDVGGKAGATPEEAAQQIIGAILSEVSREVVQAGTERLIRKGLERALQGR